MNNFAIFSYIDIVLQIVIGTFFAISGYRKSFTAQGRNRVFGLFKRMGVPGLAGWAVVLGEFLGGLGLLFGTLSWWAAAGLVPIMAGTIKLSVIPELKAKAPQGVTGWCVGFICTAEVLLLTALLALIVRGL